MEVQAEYKVLVVDLDEDEVVDETFDPLYTREAAISVADARVAIDRDENVTGLGYEVVVHEGEDVFSRAVYWTAHAGDGVVNSGEGAPPWEE
jgi:hypothetical protein